MRTKRHNQQETAKQKRKVLREQSRREHAAFERAAQNRKLRGETALMVEPLVYKLAQSNVNIRVSELKKHN